MVLSKLYKYGKTPNSHDLMKAVAIILMIIDHIGDFIYPEQVWLRIIGRGAAPIFFFLIGYSHSKNKNLDLLLFGMMITALSMLSRGTFYLNILCSFYFIRFFFDNFLSKNATEGTWCEYVHIVIAPILLVLNFIWLEYYIEYGLVGLMWSLGGYMLKRGDFKTARTYLIYASLGMVLITFLSLSIEFISYKFIALSLIGVALVFTFLSYKLKNFKTLPFPSAILFLSRYSLQIYYWHLVGFYGWKLVNGVCGF